MRKLVLALVAVFSVLGSAGAATIPTVMVRPDSQTSGLYTSVGDIATVRCSDKALAGMIRAAQVCSSPSPGRVRTLTRLQVTIALRKIGLTDKTVQLLCPQQVSISRAASTVSGQAIAEAAKQYAIASREWTGTVTAETPRLPEDVTVASGKTEIRVRDGVWRMHPGQNSVPVQISVDGKALRTVAVTVYIKMVAKVLVATQTIAKSGSIDRTNTKLQDRDVTSTPADVLTDDKTDGLVAALQITSGSVVRRSFVIQPTAIKSGDSVIIVVQNGGVRVSQKGVAMQDGRVGDTIRVKLDGSSNDVRAVITEPGLVTIQIGRRTQQ